MRHCNLNRSNWRRTSVLMLVFIGLFDSQVSALEDDADGWPREIEVEAGKVVMYQPQVDRLDGNTLHARAAVMVNTPDMEEPVFGAAWIETRIDTDLDTRTVTMDRIQVPRVRFPDATPEQEQGLIDLLTREMPTWNLNISLDRLSAMLDIAEKQVLAAEGFDDSPPIIIFRQEPTVLISIEGEPQLRQIDDSGMKAVVNTPFLIVQDPNKDNVFFLSAGADTWYRGPTAKGPWEVTKKVPKKVQELQPDDDDDDAGEAEEGPTTPPAVVVATESTELIVTEGPPQFVPLADGNLLVVSNTESDVLKEIATQRVFVLLSGRWFSSTSTDGPWEFVPSDALPESFAKIDPDSDYGYLLAWVAGTEMANDALLDSYIPQTAAVKRDATITVSFDGDPKFEPIEETSLYYAVNTESQVIRSGSQYFCVEDAVWYVASDPNGPWQVATEVPEEIRAIPASSPVYNTKYVYIYDSTPEVVYVGYYPGYTHSHHYHGSLVWGTGWWYSPWWGPSSFYPRHSTWGWGVRWNPWWGWGVGFSYSTGRFTFSVGWGGWGRRGWWGPAGYRGYRRGYARGWHHGYRSGARAGYRAGVRSSQRNSARNLYNNSNNAARVANTGRGGVQGGGAGARSPSVATGQANNVFTDKNGNVFRQQQDGSWQGRQGNQWQNTDIGAAAGSGAAASQIQQQRPGTSDRQAPSSAQTQQRATQQRQPSTSGSSANRNLNRDAQARQRGTQRTTSAPRGGSRGGGRGGGGGRRADSRGFL